MGLIVYGWMTTVQKTPKKGTRTKRTILEEEVREVLGAMLPGIGRVGLELEMARGGWLLASWVWLRKSSRLRSLWKSFLVIDLKMFDWLCKFLSNVGRVVQKTCLFYPVLAVIQCFIEDV